MNMKRPNIVILGAGFGGLITAVNLQKTLAAGDANITLINKSHNILTGNVAELRRRFSDNRYELGFEGDAKTVISTIQPMVKIIEPMGTDRDGISHVRFSLNAPDDSRDVLAAANGIAMLRTFNPLLPSMDEIFIRTVEASNSTIQAPPAL